MASSIRTMATAKRRGRKAPTIAVVHMDVNKTRRYLLSVLRNISRENDHMEVGSTVYYNEWNDDARILILCDTTEESEAFEEGYWTGEDGWRDEGRNVSIYSI